MNRKDKIDEIPDVMFRCKYCPSAFSFKSNLSQHEKAHKMLKCKKCSAAFVKRSHYNRHIRVAHPVKPSTPEEEMITCKICFRSFVGKLSLLQHMYINHPESMPGRSSASRNTHVQHSTPSRYSTSSSINQQQSIQGTSSPIQSGSSTSISIYQPQSTQSISSASSSTYQPQSTPGGSLDLEDIPRIRCKICPKTFVSKKNVNRHMLKHLKESTLDAYFRCKHCPYKAHWEKCLQIHTEHHEKVYALKCNICSYGCNKRKNLGDHMRVHTMI